MNHVGYCLFVQYQEKLCLENLRRQMNDCCCCLKCYAINRPVTANVRTGVISGKFPTTNPNRPNWNVPNRADFVEKERERGAH